MIDADKSGTPEELLHYGVKGMKWGVRKPKYTESRKEYKSRVKAERREHDEKKLDNVLKTSLEKGNDVLITTRTPGDMAITIATGKEFVDHLSRGGAFDARVTDVFAIKDNKTGQYVQNEPTPAYQKSKRK